MSSTAGGLNETFSEEMMVLYIDRGYGSAAKQETAWIDFKAEKIEVQQVEQRIGEIIKGYPNVKCMLILVSMDNTDCVKAALMASEILMKHRIQVISIVTTTAERRDVIKENIEEMRANSDLLMFFPGTGEETLWQAAQCLVAVLNGGKNRISLDFEDLESIFCNVENCYISTGNAVRPHDARDAAKDLIAFSSFANRLAYAAGMLCLIFAPLDIGLEEILEATEVIFSETAQDTNITWMTVKDESLSNQVNITVIAATK